MRVEINRIGNDTLELTEDIEAEKWDMNREDLKFSGLIHLTSTFKKTVFGLDVNVLITTNNDISCSRCLKSTSKNFEYNFKKTYDLDKISDFLDIDEDMREEILLNSPMKILCTSSCKGLCQRCGADLNSEKCNCKQ